MNERTSDRFLGGRVLACQPTEGFRSGIEAVMLAAAVPAGVSDDALELGCGVGVATLCLATRVAECRITGVDCVPELVACARENARDNGLERRLQFDRADALDLPRNLRRGFAHVFCNPPFHGDAGQSSPRRARALGRQDGGRLGDWFAAALKRVRPQGTLTAIIRADRVGEALRALPAAGVEIFPLWPRQGEAAKRVIVRSRGSSRSPLVLHSGLVLHDSNGRYTAEAERVLRDGGSLALASPHR